MPTNRSYPDISFVETDTETIANALIRGYETFTGRTLYPADPARLFILWVADIIDSTENPGIPIGNQTSQWFAVMYLSGLDHFIKD